MIMSKTDIPTHHVRDELCTTRPSYRDGRRLTSVKVYTVNQESKYLLVQNVPAVGAKDQLAKLLSSYGTIAELHPLDEFPAEDFTEVYRVKFQRIQSARFAKKKLDDHAFFGGSLHISYAPEYETVQETREKLQDRRKVIAARIRHLDQESEQDTGPQKRSRPAALQNGHQQSLPSSQQAPALPRSIPPLPPPQPAVPPIPPFSMPPPGLPASVFPPPPLSRPPPPLPPSIPPPGPPSSVFPPQPGHAPSASSAQAAALHLRNNYRYRPSSSTDSYNDRPVAPPDCESNSTADGFHGNGSIVDGGEHNDFVFSIPPPPMPGVNFDASQLRTPHFNRRDYGYAWVPSANATFPSGYDARLSQEQSRRDSECKETVSSHESDVKTVESEKHYPLSVSSALAVHRQSLSKPSEPGPKKSTSAGSKKGDKVIIRQYKAKGAPPRFVPRQIKEKKDSKPETPGKRSAQNKAKEDELNRQIRKEAFRLGEDQGPTLPSDPETKEQLLGQRPLVEPQVEASVLTSVKAIRKRLSKYISETVPKKQKIIEKSLSSAEESTTK
ncbi:proline-rich protein 12-like [Littorina saxatilis]|uniref:RNA-binding protein 48 n=1 Tax=Littorina saxatilis TaxID=31220 RepID=A0AAN9GIV6_9CAEN